MKIKARNYLYVVLFAIAISGISFNAKADDAKTETFNYTILGAPSCENWRQNSTSKPVNETAKRNVLWLVGYISGLAEAYSLKFNTNILDEGNISGVAVVQSTIVFCTVNPYESVASAAKMYLVEQIMQKNPKEFRLDRNQALLFRALELTAIDHEASADNRNEAIKSLTGALAVMIRQQMTHSGDVAKKNAPKPLADTPCHE